jgi:phytoene dehydrogenase-like protein
VPSLYEELLHPRHVPASVLDDVRRFQWDTSTVKVDWALDAPIPWHAAEARRAGTVHVADDFDNLTESAAHIAMGLLPSRPFLVVGQQSISDPSRSPPGTETAWAYTHVPQRLRGDAKGVLDVGHGEPSWIDGFVERMELRIEHLANGFGALVRGRHVLTPSGLQAANPNLHGGSISGGTSQLHQLLLFRPIPGSGRAETPIAGLYLASAAAHPGGGVHGAAGATAARAATLWAPRPRAFLFGRGWSARS